MAQRGFLASTRTMGNELWQCKTVGGYVSSTPVVRKDILYIIGSSFERKPWRPSAPAAGATSPRRTWFGPTPRSAPAIVLRMLIGERLFFFSGQATCLNSATGEVISQQRLDGVTQLYSSPSRPAARSISSRAIRGLCAVGGRQAGRPGPQRVRRYEHDQRQPGGERRQFVHSLGAIRVLLTEKV